MFTVDVRGLVSDAFMSIWPFQLISVLRDIIPPLMCLYTVRKMMNDFHVCECLLMFQLRKSLQLKYR